MSCVVLFHLRPALLPGGFCGVDVFFVISGYVVSASLERRTFSRVGPYLSAFYARRIVRIYPALVVMLLGTAILQTLFVPASWLSDTAERTGTFAFFGASNMALVWYDDGYFAPRAEFNTFTHTWSLGVEEQFYLLFPLLFRAWSARRAHRWLAIPAIASLVYSAVATALAPAHAFYLLPSRLWELTAGAMLFALHAEGRCIARAPAIRCACGVGGVALIIVACCTDRFGFPFPWAIVAVAGTLLAIASAVDATVRFPAALLFLGKASYSVYLWHWPVLVLLRWTVGLEGPATITAALALTAIASIASYEMVEMPVRRRAAVTRRPAWQLVAAGVLVTGAAAWVVTSVVFASQPSLSLSVTRDRRTWYPEPWPIETATVASRPSFAGRTIFVLGDSHVWAYGTMLRQMTDERGARVRQYTEPGCTVADLLRPLRPGCDAFVRRTVAAITREAAPGDVVFLAALRMNRLGDQWATFDASTVAAAQHGPEAASARAVAFREADELVTALERAGLQVLIDAPLPVFRAPPFRCADWFNVRNPVCAAGLTVERAFLEEHRAPVMASLESLGAAHSRLAVWDPFPLLCPSATCAAFDDGGPLFFDGDHLSAHGNRVLYPDFVALVASLWGDRTRGG